jgi:hypothetical protein
MIDHLGFRALSTAIVVALLGTLLSGNSGASAHNAVVAVQADGVQRDPAGQQRDRDADPREEDALVGLGEPVVRFGARARGPAQDYPRLPERCLGPKEIIPHSPQKCRLVRFMKGRPTVVLWGDSHAWQHIPALRAAARERKMNLVAYVFGSCAPFKMVMRRDLGSYKLPCELNNALALDYISRRHRAGAAIRVVLGGHWWGNRYVYRHQSRFSGYQVQHARLFHHKGPPLFRALGRRGIDTDVIGQAAVVPWDPPRCSQRDPYTCDLPRRRAIRQEHTTRQWLRAQMEHLAGHPRLIDVNRRFCGPWKCRGRANRIFTFYDDNHLSATRTRTLKREFLPSFGNFR